MANPSSSSLTTSKFSPNTDTITIAIGPDCKPFSIHKHLLTAQSLYLASRLASRVATNVVPLQLSDLDPGSFSCVVEYLYTGTISHDAFDNLSPTNANKDAVLALIGVWETASTLSMPPLHNLVMGHLHRTFNAEHASAQHAILWGGPNQDAYQHDLLYYVWACYEGTKDGCALRRWIPDLYACGLAKTKRGAVDKQTFRGQCPKDFLMDVVWKVDDLRWDMRNGKDDFDGCYSFEEFKEQLDVGSYEARESDKGNKAGGGEGGVAVKDEPLE